MQIFTEDGKYLAPEIERAVAMVAARFYRRNKWTGYNLDDLVQTGRALALEMRDALEEWEEERALSYFARSLHNCFVCDCAKIKKKKRRAPDLCFVGEYGGHDPRVYDADPVQTRETDALKRRLTNFVIDELHASNAKTRRIIEMRMCGLRGVDIAALLGMSRGTVSVIISRFIRRVQKDAGQPRLSEARI